MGYVYEYRHSGNPLIHYVIILVILLSSLVMSLDFAVLCLFLLYTTLISVPKARLRVFPDHIEIGNGLFYIVRNRIANDDIKVIMPVRFSGTDDRKAWKEWGAYVFDRNIDGAIAIRTSKHDYIIGCNEPEQVVDTVRKSMGLESPDKRPASDDDKNGLSATTPYPSGSMMRILLSPPVTINSPSGVS
jgi:hypothetical protein